jgi:predicted nucleic acid-binding protein
MSIAGSRLPGIRDADRVMGTSIHLDTNYLIRFAGNTSQAITIKVIEWLEKGFPIEVSAMAWAEFRCGPLSEDDCTLVAEILSGVLPVSREIADEGARLFNATGRRSRSLPDCIIAATAISSGSLLATENRADFEPFLEYGLKLAS